MNFSIPSEYRPEKIPPDQLPYNFRRYLYSFMEINAFKLTEGYVSYQKIQLPNFCITFHKASVQNETWLPVSFGPGESLLTYLLNGNVFFDDEQENFGIVISGDCRLHYEHNRIYQVCLAPGEYESLHIEFEHEYLNQIESDCLEINKIIHMAKNLLPKQISAPSTKLTKAICIILEEIRMHSGNNTPYFLNAKINQLVVHYLDALIPKDSKVPLFANDKEKLLEIKKFINMNLDISHNTALIARRFAMSETDLRRKFKALFHCTLFSFILECRMEKAMHLVKHTPLPISQIGFRVGFEDVSNFSSAFRNYFKNCPSYFRKKLHTLV